MTNELAYLAGLVDGEGSVGFFSNGADRAHVFVIEVKMTNEPVIDWLVGEFGGNKVARPSKNPKWKDQWRWRIKGEKAVSLYERLLPMLKIKRL